MRRSDTIVRMTVLLVVAASPRLFAQTPGGGTSPSAPPPNVFFDRTTQAGGATVSVKVVRNGTAAVTGAPYSATITNESIQTLADGNRIVVKTTGLIARDSLGRTRQQMELPAIGNLSAANVPQIVFIQDPVAQVSYMLNLTDNTARSVPVLPPALTGPDLPGPARRSGPGTALVIAGAAVEAGALLPPPPSKDFFFVQKGLDPDQPGQTTTEDLGSRMIEGVVANGTRTTLTIPAGQIGNDQPINVVTEVWMSPDLKAIAYSKRSDPRMGEQIFQLTNIQRIEPEASLFTVPSDFTIVDGPPPIVYKLKQ